MMWVIYDHPKDFPDKFVAREWNIGPGRATPLDNVITSNDLEELREQMVQKCLTKIIKSNIDDPCIVETWM